MKSKTLEELQIELTKARSEVESEVYAQNWAQAGLIAREAEAKAWAKAAKWAKGDKALADWAVVYNAAHEKITAGKVKIKEFESKIKALKVKEKDDG